MRVVQIDVRMMRGAIPDSDPGPFVVSPYVLAALDYPLATRRGVEAQLTALSELASGAWDLRVARPRTYDGLTTRSTATATRT